MNTALDNASGLCYTTHVSQRSSYEKRHRERAFRRGYLRHLPQARVSQRLRSFSARAWHLRGYEAPSSCQTQIRSDLHLPRVRQWIDSKSICPRSEAKAARLKEPSRLDRQSTTQRWWPRGTSSARSPRNNSSGSL